MSGEPVVSKDQRAGRIKWSNIEVQIHTITSEKNYGQVGNFGDGAIKWIIKQAKSNWRSCGHLQVVSIHKFEVYKAVSRSRVDKSSERDFIKVILTKDQGRGKENKEWMRIRKSRCVKSNWTCCCTVSRLLMVDFILFSPFTLFYFTFLFPFNFLFLEQLRLGFISHAVTSITNWWCSHKTDHGTWRMK